MTANYAENLTLDADPDEVTTPILLPPTRAERISAMESAVTPLAAPPPLPAHELGFWERLGRRIGAFLGGRVEAEKPVATEKPVDAEVAWAEQRVLAAAERAVDTGVRYEQDISPPNKRAYWAACVEMEFAVNGLRSARRRAA